MKKKLVTPLTLRKKVISNFKSEVAKGGGASNEPTECCIDPGASASCAPTYCRTCDITCRFC
ncbi:hypothetical protein [Ascidiimonas aurantiaca]|uniref:hypothetical protein n=1 Tax=Ascidiimonas aurantiaca TaxID=1685432 RepID=UPI0030EF63FF